MVHGCIYLDILAFTWVYFASHNKYTYITEILLHVLLSNPHKKIIEAKVVSDLTNNLLGRLFIFNNFANLAVYL